MLEKCDHPNIISVFDAYQIKDDSASIYLVTSPWAPYTLGKFLHDGDSLRRSVCPWFTEGSIEAERKIIRIFTGLADGLDYLHGKSIKHKDLKPENILLHEPSSENIRPIIADLGVSKTYKEGNPTNFYNSTYTYLAPEQIDSIERTLRADIWQLGCCFALALAVFHEGSAGCRQLWNSFENTDEDYSGNIAKESATFMKTLQELCRVGTPAQCRLHRLVTGMLELDPAARFDIRRVKMEIGQLV